MTTNLVTEVRPDALDAYIASFAGYGNAQAPVWFVGMEEGSGRGLDELARRVHVWSNRGRQTLEDLPSYHHAIGMPRHFQAPWPLQRTWTPLIRLLLAWRGITVSHAELRRVQATELGTFRGDSTLVELLPLPASSLAHWPYAELGTNHPSLKDRSTYHSTYMPLRIGFLNALISQCGARAVVCYGLGYLEAWKTLSGVEPEQRIDGGQRWLWGQIGERQFAFVPHPVARGIPTVFWSRLGEELRKGVD